jgi:hypothetical protein
VCFLERLAFTPTSLKPSVLRAPSGHDTHPHRAHNPRGAQRTPLGAPESTHHRALRQCGVHAGGERDKTYEATGQLVKHPVMRGGQPLHVLLGACEGQGEAASDMCECESEKARGWVACQVLLQSSLARSMGAGGGAAENATTWHSISENGQKPQPAPRHRPRGGRTHRAPWWNGVHALKVTGPRKTWRCASHCNMTSFNFW